MQNWTLARWGTTASTASDAVLADRVSQTVEAATDV